MNSDIFQSTSYSAVDKYKFHINFGNFKGNVHFPVMYATCQTFKEKKSSFVTEHQQVPLVYLNVTPMLTILIKS